MGGLSKKQRLDMHQLRLLDWAERRSSADDIANADEQSAGAERLARLSNPWLLTQGLTLAPWQEEARDAWFEAGRRGMIKVVTGAGKTVVALAIAERLQRLEPKLRVVVVVPTIVLMQQWYATFLERSNLPREAVGRLGGGQTDDFGEPRRVLIAVLASARKVLPTLVQQAGVGDHLLFIADECHRVGSPEMSAVLRTQRSYALGLSATPEREETGDEPGVSGSLSRQLDTEIGAIVYEMTFAQAIRSGVLPPFEVHHFGLPLNADEARRYQALTRAINDARRELLAASPAARKAGGGDQLVSWARRVSGRGASHLAGLASKFINDTGRRKQLLYRAASRAEASRTLVREALAARRDARVILFHESIDEVVSLFELLVDERLPVVMEHSELSTELREAGLDLFRTGVAQVVVSARSLIEGFNVPEADLGIIVASSSSPRQRIQSIGRVLRKYRDRSGEQKSSRVCVLYIRDTVDEAIYGKEDWDRLIGVDRNRYFAWDPPADPIEQLGPPRAAVPSEAEIDLDGLSPGDVYPGRYEGVEFSAGSLGNVTDTTGRVARNPQGVSDLVARLKGQPGRFKVTQRRRAILVLVLDGNDGWRTLYGGTLKEPFQFGRFNDRIGEVDVSSLAPGDPYAGPIEPAVQFRFRQRGGGVIARRVRGGEVFARGRQAEQLISTLREISRTHRPISRILVNELGHALWLEEGAPRFIAALEGQLEFPEHS
jgi:superfamily II DNA or RNA helicase